MNEDRVKSLADQANEAAVVEPERVIVQPTEWFALMDAIYDPGEDAEEEVVNA